MKVLIQIGILFLTLNCFAQQKETLPAISFKSITNENITDAIKMLGIDVFNIQFPLIKQKESQLTVYLEEHANGVLMDSQEIFSRYYEKSMQGHDQLSIIIRKVNDSLLSTAIKTSQGENILPIKKDSKYNLPHEVVRFKEQTVLPGKKIPLILYGSMWHDPKIPGDGLRFCLEKRLKPDFSSEAFRLMPHYYLFLIEIK